MKKNKILSVLTMFSLWSGIALANLEQLRMGHCVVVLTIESALFGQEL